MRAIYTGTIIASAAAVAAVAWLALRAPENAADGQPRSATESMDTQASAPPQALKPSPVPAVEVANAPMRAASQDRGEVVLRAAWGDGPGQLGHRQPAEGEAEGPMSFAVDASRQIHVLDQVNSRVELFEQGGKSRSIPVARPSFQDIASDGKGGWILLDRLVSPAIAFVAQDGTTREVALVGPGIEEGAAVTALVPRGDGVWVEVEHSDLVRVADSNGAADPSRPHAAGRFSADGTVNLRAELSGPGSVSVMSQPAGLESLSPNRALNVSFSEPVLNIATLETDSSKRTILVATLAPALSQERRFGSGKGIEHLEAVVLGTSGTEVDRFSMPKGKGSEEQFRPVTMGADGALYQMTCDDEGLTVRRYAL